MVLAGEDAAGQLQGRVLAKAEGLDHQHLGADDAPGGHTRVGDLTLAGAEEHRGADALEGDRQRMSGGIAGVERAHGRVVTVALDAMQEVGPGGHFFGAQHTLERYSTAFYQPLISDWRNFQSWQAAGSPTAEKKANALWKQALAEYREPYLDPAALEQIDAFVARRIREGGEKTDF